MLVETRNQYYITSWLQIDLRFLTGLKVLLEYD